MSGIFTYIYHKNQPNVGKYTSPMDPMGNALLYSLYNWGPITRDWSVTFPSLLRWPPCLDFLQIVAVSLGNSE